MTIVRFSCASWRMVFSTSPTSSGSRADVGSSNKITSGRIASARAIATAAADRRTDDEDSCFLYRSAPLSPAAPGREQWIRFILTLDDNRPFNDVFQYRTMREQVEILEHEPHMLAQAANQPFCWLKLRAVSMVTSPTRMVPLSGCSSRLILRSSVVLPDPLGPMIATTSSGH